MSWQAAFIAVSWAVDVPGDGLAPPLGERATPESEELLRALRTGDRGGRARAASGVLARVAREIDGLLVTS